MVVKNCARADDVGTVEILATLLDGFPLENYETVDKLWQKLKEGIAFCEKSLS